MNILTAFPLRLRASAHLAGAVLLAACFCASAPAQTAANEGEDRPEWAPDAAQPAAAPTIPPELEAFANSPRSPRRVTNANVPQPPQFSPPAPPAFTPPARPQPATPTAAPADAAPQTRQADPSRTSDLAAKGMDLEASVGTIQFSDMPVNDILDMLQNMTGRSVLRQSAVGGSFSFRSQGPLTRGQCIEAIVSLLSLNGIAVTPLGDRYIKAVPATAASSHSPTLIEGTTLQYAQSQEVCSKLFIVDFLPVEDAVKAFSALQSGLVGTSVTSFDKSRTILATDCLINLQRMETLLSRIDKPASGQSKMLFFPLRNIAATDALKRCQQLITGALAARFQGNTTVDADDRTNQLIVFTHPANETMIRELVDSLDRDVDPLTRTEMFSVRHADATELCDIIKEVVTGQEQARDSSSSSPVRQRAQPQAGQAQAVAETAGTQFSSYLTIVPDERTNTILATGTPSDLRLLGNMIGQLDALLPQVRIEVIIAEVTLTNGQSSGLESFGIRYASTAPDDSLSGDITAGNGINGGDKGVWLSPVIRGDGLTISPFDIEDLSMDVVFNVCKTNSNVQVLSAPNIVTTHNREASIIVGSREPVVTTAVTGTSSSDSSDMVANIDYEDVALELTVKPLIGSNGIIQMEITQKINEVTSRVTLAGLGQQPVIGTRQASSFVSVGNGRMVVLGGLQKLKDTNNDDKVFILGDIPLLGRLFRPSNTEVARTELLIFIRPIVITTTEEADADARSKLGQIAPSSRVQNYLDNGSFIEPADDEQQEDSPTADRPARPRAMGRK